MQSEVLKQEAQLMLILFLYMKMARYLLVITVLIKKTCFCARNVLKLAYIQPYVILKNFRMYNTHEPRKKETGQTEEGKGWGTRREIGKQGRKLERGRKGAGVYYSPL